MPPLFTLTTEIISIAQQAVTDLINNLGKDCTLYYPSRSSPCPNCLPGPGNRPTVRWRTGGPIPFQDGSLCPMCNGKNQLFEDQSEKITMLCAWTPKEWFLKPSSNVRIPDNQIQTKGFIGDLPKVARADSMVVESAIGAYKHYRFKLASEPIDPSNIVQVKFFVATWERAGG